jgi:iron complex outermembrane receptor protein
MANTRATNIMHSFHRVPKLSRLFGRVDEESHGTSVKGLVSMIFSIPLIDRRGFALVVNSLIVSFVLVNQPAALAGQGLQSGSPSGLSSEQQNLKQMTLEELGNVEVSTFNKTPTPLHETPAAIYVITNDQILRSGVSDIADALRLAPGVQVGRLSSTTWAVGIRGLQNNFSKSVLVLIDGRNVYTQLFAGVYWDVQDLPLSDIDRIEVIRGPGGTIWGPNSANGVINIITKKAGEMEGLHATVLGGTADHFVGSLNLGFAQGENAFRVYGRGFERAHEYHTDGINDDTWQQERLGFRADHIANSRSAILEGDIYRGDSPHIVGTAVQNDQTSGGDLNFRFEQPRSDGTGLTVQAYFDRQLRTGGALGETRNTIDLDAVERVRLGDAQLLSFGAGLRWSPYRIIAQIPGETLVPSSGTDHNHTGFIQDEARLGEHISLTVGAKLQHNNYTGFDILPSARLLWSPTAKRSIWAGITRSVTTPSDLEENFLLSAAAPDLVFQLLGNPQFKSENVLGYEGGYRGLISKHLFIDASIFRNHYGHLQSFGPTIVSKVGSTTYLTINYTNQIHGDIYGFEIAPQISIAQPWRLNLTYSYIEPHFVADGATSDISSTGSVNTYQHSSPKNQFVAQSMIDLPWKISFDQTYRYVSALAAQKVPAYQTMDLHLGRPVGSKFTLELVGQNLFQPHHYEWGTGDPAQPPVGILRAGYVRLSLHSSHVK